MDFKNFVYIKESKPEGEISAFAMEQAIPELWNSYLENDRNIEKTLINLPNDLKEHKEITEKFLENLVETLQPLLGNETMTFIGDGHPTIKLSDYWKKASGKTRGDKPKTDFLTPSRDYKISFRKPGGSVLFFGSSSDTLATFYAAFDDFKQKPVNFEKIINMVKTHLSKFKISSPISKLKNQLNDTKEILQPYFSEQGLNIDKEGDLKKFVSDSDDVKDAISNLINLRRELIEISNARSLKDELLKHLKIFFEENLEYKAYYILEALSGKYKFGVNEIGSANYIMATSQIDVINKKSGKTIIPAGESKVRKIDYPLAVSLANSKNIKLHVDFKTSNKDAWSAIKLSSPTVFKKERDTFFGAEEYINNAVNEYILNESVIGDVGKWLLGLARWLYNKIILIFKKGLKFTMEFFGVDPEIIIEDNTNFKTFYKMI